MRAILLGVLVLAGCETLEAPDDSIPCDQVSVVVGANTPPDGVRADTKLRGYVMSPDGVAVRRVTVQGIVAKRIGFNFSEWEADLPIVTLRRLALDALDGEEATDVVPVELSLFAEHACGWQESTAVIDVEPGDGMVTSLAVALRAPNASTTFIPADGSVPATVEVTTPQGVGSGTPVELTVTGGRVLASRVILQAAGSGGGSASTLAFATEEGTVRVDARVEDVFASGTILAVGAPDISPSGGMLLAGQSIDVAVETRGALRECEAIGSANLVATVSGSNLGEVPVTSFADPTRAIVRVTASETENGGRLTLTCRDVYGQTTRAVFEHGGGATPPPEQEPPP
ncbi:MAG: hypothetical protein IT379_30625 [Deltaproteobacteria bacterium]|nr:hypothetical protein [Deltaproteobacteria bacterium]